MKKKEGDFDDLDSAFISDEDSDEDYQKIEIVEDSSLNLPSPQNITVTSKDPTTPNNHFNLNCHALPISTEDLNEDIFLNIKSSSAQPVSITPQAVTNGSKINKDYSEDARHNFDPILPQKKKAISFIESACGLESIEESPGSRPRLTAG